MRPGKAASGSPARLNSWLRFPLRRFAPKQFLVPGGRTSSEKVGLAARCHAKLLPFASFRGSRVSVPAASAQRESSRPSLVAITVSGPPSTASRVSILLASTGIVMMCRKIPHAYLQTSAWAGSFGAVCLALSYYGDLQTPGVAFLSRETPERAQRSARRTRLRDILRD